MRSDGSVEPERTIVVEPDDIAARDALSTVVVEVGV